VLARLARQVEVGLATVDLSLAQYRFLALLAEGSSAASALASGLTVSRPSVTAVADGLVSRGLVERRADGDDRRVVGHTLTAKGRQMPDHYCWKKGHFGSVSSPIGTQITQAVGFAWAAKLKKDDLVALVYFGEARPARTSSTTG